MGQFLDTVQRALAQNPQMVAQYPQLTQFQQPQTNGGIQATEGGSLANIIPGMVQNNTLMQQRQQGSQLSNTAANSISNVH